jgi:hypothetical protein
VRVPLRVHDALKRRELSFGQYALLVFLCGEVDFRTGRAALTLRALADGCGWPTSHDWLRKTLVSLRRHGWIECDSRPGQQKPYVISLRDAAVRQPTSDPISAGGPPAVAEATSDSPHATAARGARRRAVSEPARPQTQPPREDERRRVDDGVDRSVELRALLKRIGHLSASQRDEIATAYAVSPSGVRACIAAALKGRTPAALLTRLIRDGEHLEANDPNAEWFVQIPVRHPDDPALDDVQVLGPFATVEAARAASSHPDAVVVAKERK